MPSMEAFSLLKHWRGDEVAANVRTISAAVSSPAVEVEEYKEDSDDDDGPFFDLEFTLPDDTDGDGEEDGSFSTDEERRSVGSEERNDRSLAVSSSPPSDDVFFKGDKIRQLDLPECSPSPNSRPLQFPVSSLLKSATKFRVFLLGFSKKPKPPVEPAGSPRKPQQNRLFAVKVEEVRIASLFTRENSTRSSTGKPQKPGTDDGVAGGISPSDARRFAKVVMQKYTKMIKPLKVRVSRRQGEKVVFPGQPTPEVLKSAPAPTKGNVQKERKSPAGIVGSRLGKSRSASAAVAAAPAWQWQQQQQQQRKRDDSLLLQQDGIQSAIAHCKRSFNASSSSSKEMEISLSRSSSDPSADGCLRNLSNK